MIGCGKSDFNGTFKGTEKGTQDDVAFTQEVTLTLTQDGDKVSGTWSGDSGSAGQVSGKADGDSLKSLSITQTGCTGSFSGDGKIDGDKLTGSISGTNGCSTLSATFDSKRQ